MERLHATFRFGDQRGVDIGILALDDEVGHQEEILGRELAASILLGCARKTIEKMLDGDSQKV